MSTRSWAMGSRDAALAAHDEAREAATGLLLTLVAGVFAPPRESLRDDLRTGRLRQACEQLASQLGVPAPQWPRVDWTELQAAHVDLFVSSGSGLTAVPYVGYAVDDEVLGPTAEALARFFREHQVTPNPDWRDLPDHVAAVAEAGALLHAADRPEAAHHLALRYLRPWFERYAAAIQRNDSSGFYASLTRFLHQALGEVTREDAVARS